MVLPARVGNMPVVAMKLLEDRMPNRVFVIVCVALLASLSHAWADDYQIDIALFQGDPKGSREAGTLKPVSGPTIAALAGQQCEYRLGGTVLIGKQAVPVGRQVTVTATDAGDGAIKLEVVFENSVQSGPAAAPRVKNTRTEATKTVQSGGQVRLDLGDDPKNLNWVVLTVRKVK
jgi:hypothetical protein